MQGVNLATIHASYIPQIIPDSVKLPDGFVFVSEQVPKVWAIPILMTLNRLTY